jgi:hypothetical protein
MWFEREAVGNPVFVHHMRTPAASAGHIAVEGQVREYRSSPMSPHFRLVGLFAAMFAATLIAPLAAPISLVFIEALRDGSADMILFAPLSLFTIPGMYGYVLAFAAVLLLGTALTALSLPFPVLRRKLVWLAAGAFFGALMGLAFIANGWGMPIYGAIAGSACALTYRLIVGPALRVRPKTKAEAGMATR